MTDLSDLIKAGLAGCELQFLPETMPVSAEVLAGVGEKRFSDKAESSRLGLIMTNDRPTVESLLGAVLAGVAVVSLPLPSRGADLAEYVGFIHEACRDNGVGEVVARDDVAALLSEAGVPARGHGEIGSSHLASPSATGFSLTQFSSGSTGSPKGVTLSDEKLGANVAAIISRVNPSPGDVTVSWLPLSHDMGLIGMLLTSIASCGPAWVGYGSVALIMPAQFLRRPGVWMEAVGHLKGTFTAAPDFGYRMATRYGATSYDLSSLRCAIVGGEIVRHETLQEFSEAFFGSGFEDVAICPAYGLSEVGLAISLTSPLDRYRLYAPDDRAYLRPLGHTLAASFVSSGPVLDGYTVRISDIGEPDLGNIQIHGPSIGVESSTGVPLADGEGWLSTGDYGLFDEDWLYVCGRTDDYFVANGRKIYAPKIEEGVGRVSGVRAGRVTAVGLTSGDWALAVEHRSVNDLSDDEVKRFEREVRHAAVASVGVEPSLVVVLPKGALPLTASGKLQRHSVRRHVESGAWL